MITKEFVALEKNRALKKALNFWYKYFKDTCNLKDFISKCRWKKENKNYIVIYKGQPPLIK